MDKKSNLDSSGEFLLNSSAEIVSILKTIAHKKRFEILILLLDGPLTFQILLEETNLKKSALANHLNDLKEKFLVEKIQHGTYKITDDGKTYIKSIETAYRENITMKRKIEETKQRLKLTKSFLERNKK